MTAATAPFPSAPTARQLGRGLAGALAAAALVAALGAVGWLVLAASERPSTLSLVARRGGQPWVLGPLAGALPGLTTNAHRLHVDFTTAMAVLLVAWLLAWATAAALPRAVVAGAVALAQLVTLPGTPQPASDVFNYVLYGRMAASGVNPYRVAPLATPHDELYRLANWHALPSPYGPLFTLLCEPLGRMSPQAAFWAWRVLVVAASLGVLALVWWMAGRLGRSPQRAVVAAGLCPVTLAMGLGGFHNDALAVLGVVGAATCLLAGDRAGGTWRAWAPSAAAGALAVLAAGVKPSFAIVVGVVVLGAPRRLAAAAGAAVAGAVVLAVVGLVFGGALPDVRLQSQLVTPLSLPSLAGLALGHGGADAAARAWGRDALAVVVLAATAAVAWRRRLALGALGVVCLAAALSLAWVMPWYLAWWLPFAALARPRALVPLAVAGCLWLGVGGIPQFVPLLHDAGYYPTRTATGHANHAFEQRLVR